MKKAVRHCSVCGFHTTFEYAIYCHGVDCPSGHGKLEECFRGDDQFLCCGRIVAGQFLSKLNRELCIKYTGGCQSNKTGWALFFPDSYSTEPLPISEFLKQSRPAKELFWERFRAMAAKLWPD